MHSLYTIQLHGPLDTSFTFAVEGAACPGPNFSQKDYRAGTGGREQSAPPGIGRRFLNSHGPIMAEVLLNVSGMKELSK